MICTNNSIDIRIKRSGGKREVETISIIIDIIITIDNSITVVINIENPNINGIICGIRINYSRIDSIVRIIRISYYSINTISSAKYSAIRINAIYMIWIKSLIGLATLTTSQTKLLVVMIA